MDEHFNCTHNGTASQCVLEQFKVTFAHSTKETFSNTVKCFYAFEPSGLPIYMKQDWPNALGIANLSAVISAAGYEASSGFIVSINYHDKLPDTFSVVFNYSMLGVAFSRMNSSQSY